MIRNKWRGFAFSLAAVFAGIFFLDRLFPPPIDKVRTSIVVTDHEGFWLHGFTVEDTNGEKRWRLAADVGSVDPSFIDRLIAIEDKRFWSHPGVDAVAVMRATGSFVRQGKVVSGASTITMQTARLMEPRPRTVISKIIEMIRALQIEARLSKQEILELYLTLAPYGGNLEGIRSASLAYFGKEPAHLTDAQQAMLIALPQAPEARRPDRRSGNAKKARKEILQKLRDLELLTGQQFIEASDAVLPDLRRPFKRLAWHASFEHRNRDWAEDGNVTLTLNAGMQDTVEALVRDEAARLRDRANLSVLVVENDSKKVRAAIGSASLDLPGGWIDMTRAERSPGSALKPFIYGLAFEDGFASGHTLIDDAPYSFDGYKPENFTRVFHGDVTVSEALQHSLNVPAVLALDKVGPKRFAASLQASGVSAQMPVTADRQASLAIALGGIGLTARDLAMLYTGLATGGEITPLVWREHEPALADSYRLLTESSARRLTKIMKMAPAPAGRTPAALSVDAPAVAFKTGTSYGYRDAWAAGYTEDYTVIVWAGHPNGSPRPGITGREAALPLLFEIFDRLEEFGPAVSPVLDGDEGEYFQTGTALSRLSPTKRDMAPEIVFPENGVTIFYSEEERDRGFALAARGGAGDYRWYVDGKYVSPEKLGGRSIWRPESTGFYEVTVVDFKGRKTQSSVRVLSAG